MRLAGLKRLLQIFSIITCLFLGGVAVAQAKEAIPLYTYYFEAPFILGDNKGLTHDLVGYLNSQDDSPYHFEVQLLPRKRLDILLDDGVDGVLPFANPDWFKNAKRSSFHWTGPIMSGANTVITNISDALTYEGPDSLTHLTLIGSLGRRYKGFEQLVETKKLERIDMPRYNDVYAIIGERPGFFTVSSQAIAQYLIRQLKLKGKVHVAQPFHSSYQRHFLVSGQDETLKNYMTKLSKKLAADPKWHAILSAYGLENLKL